MATQIYQNYTFLPTQIPGCQVWFDAADTSTFSYSSGTNISQWRDKSSNAYLVIQPTIANQPSLTSSAQNQLSGIQFATSTWLYQTATSMPNFTTGANTSVLIAARNASLNTGWNITNTIWFTTTGVNATARYHFSFNQGATDGTTLFANGSLVGQVTSNAVSTNANTIFGFTASATSTTIHTNGSSNSYPGVSLPDATGSTVFIFNDPRNIAGLSDNIMIFEMVGYNTQITTSQRQQLEGYLAWKWSMVNNLPMDHPYKNNPPFMNTLSLPVTPTLVISAQRNSIFSPNDITGLALWLDGQDPNANGQLPPPGFPVTVWKDKVADKNAIAGGTSSPRYIQNGGIYLNGSAYYTNTNFNYNLASRTMFIVFEVNVYNVAFGIFPFIPTPNSGTDYTSTSGLTIEQNVSGLRVYGNSGGYLAEIGGSSTVLLNPHIYYETMNGRVGSTFFDGGSSNATSASYTAGTASGYGIGTRWLSGAPSLANTTNGVFYEVLLYNSPLTTAQRQQIEGYLAWKWGLQANLPVTHPYYDSPFPNLSYAPIPPKPPQIKSAAWQPNQLQGATLAFWVDAADTNTIQTTGTTVTGVTDKSPSPKTITVTNTVSYISKQSIVFTNTNGRLNVSGMPAAPYDILTVATANSVTNIFRTLLRTLNTANPFLLNINTNDLGIWDGIGFRQFGSLTMTPNEQALVYASMASNSTMQASKNGTISLTSPTPALNESAIAFIGNNTGTGGQPWGTLQEMVIYSTNLTTKQRQQVEGYLAWKWNLQNSLPGNHPYKLFPPSP